MSKTSPQKREKKRPGITKMYWEFKMKWPQVYNSLIWQRVYEMYDKSKESK